MPYLNIEINKLPKKDRLVSKNNLSTLNSRLSVKILPFGELVNKV